MKTFLSIIFASCTFFNANSQIIEGEKQPLSKEDKALIKEILLSKSKTILSDVAKEACLCIDSIKVLNKNADDTALEIKDCIDQQVMSYQVVMKMLQLESDSIKIDAENSPEYEKYYFEIERQLMDSCKATRQIIGANNVERKKSYSKNPEALEEYNKGNEYIRNEDYKGALPFYKKAVKIDPEFVFAWDNLGLCYRKTGKLDKALEAYQTSLKIDPKGMMPLQNISFVYIYKKEYENAIRSYLKLAELDSKNPEVYYGIGQICFEYLHEYERSLDYMCKAYLLYLEQKSPYRTDAEKIIGMVYTKMKEEGKEKRFNEILKANNLTPDK